MSRKKHPINMSIDEEFTALDEALEWLETYGGGKYFSNPSVWGNASSVTVDSRVRIKSRKKKMNP